MIVNLEKLREAIETKHAGQVKVDKGPFGLYVYFQDGQSPLPLPCLIINEYGPMFLHCKEYVTPTHFHVWMSISNLVGVHATD